MTKVRTSIYIDEEVLRKSREIGLNISRICENSLRNIIETLEGKTDKYLLTDKNSVSPGSSDWWSTALVTPSYKEYRDHFTPTLSLKDIPIIIKENIKLYEKWLKNTRNIGRKTLRDRVNYSLKPLDTSIDHSIKAYRLALHFLRDRYGIEIRNLLDKLKIKRSSIDLKIPSEHEIINSLKIAEKTSYNLSIFYKLLLATGLRKIEVVYLLRTFNKKKLRKGNDIYTYPINWKRGNKKSFYAFIPSILAHHIRRITLSEYYYTNMSRKKNLVRAKYIRKFVATKMYELGISSEVIDFIQGRTPSSILAKHYLGIHTIAIKQYHKYSRWIEKILDRTQRYTECIAVNTKMYQR